ncbi:hypothetical protein EDD18DRAFT_1107256 [Armillaria luteobubalina]|uniref:Uncharacterized protein n=1 Tax=Armillaria luteobubalina TaxID=153913 RepID=A0AA39Q0X3_9AGAR|nr:hypothetical protein EDD18DRAFT_1107256 [Armillaria luteobubalina]
MMQICSSERPLAASTPTANSQYAFVWGERMSTLLYLYDGKRLRTMGLVMLFTCYIRSVIFIFARGLTSKRVSTHAGHAFAGKLSYILATRRRASKVSAGVKGGYMCLVQHPGKAPPEAIMRAHGYYGHASIHDPEYAVPSGIMMCPFGEQVPETATAESILRATVLPSSTTKKQRGKDYRRGNPERSADFLANVSDTNKYGFSTFFSSRWTISITIYLICGSSSCGEQDDIQRRGNDWLVSDGPLPPSSPTSTATALLSGLKVHSYPPIQWTRRKGHTSEDDRKRHLLRQSTAFLRCIERIANTATGVRADMMQERFEAHCRSIPALHSASPEFRENDTVLAQSMYVKGNTFASLAAECERRVKEVELRAQEAGSARAGAFLLL